MAKDNTPIKYLIKFQKDHTSVKVSYDLSVPVGGLPTTHHSLSSPPHLCELYPSVGPMKSGTSTFFQVPYPATPLFATLFRKMRLQLL